MKGDNKTYDRSLNTEIQKQLTKNHENSWEVSAILSTLKIYIQNCYNFIHQELVR